LRLLDSPSASGFTLAFDTAGQGPDIGAWGVPAIAVKRLNAWCLQAVDEFWKAIEAAAIEAAAIEAAAIEAAAIEAVEERRSDPPTEEALVDGDKSDSEAIPEAKRYGPQLGKVIPLMRQTDAAELKAMSGKQMADRYTSSPRTCGRARRIVIAEDDQRLGN
jgi:hypothetical protein